MVRRANDIKAPDGFLLGGLRKVRADGTVLFQRGYWQAPRDWAGERVWLHDSGDHCDGKGPYAAPPGMHVFDAKMNGTHVYLIPVDRKDAKPAFRNPAHKAWSARHK